MPPAVGATVKPRRLARLDAPHLLFAAPVVLSVVGDAQRRRARLVPVGEQHGERAEPWRKRRAHGVIGLVAWLWAIKRVPPAGASLIWLPTLRRSPSLQHIESVAVDLLPL